MRTNIVIDDELMRAAQEVAGTKTKRDTVEQALREMVDRRRRQALLELRGKYQWEGDLSEMRANRF